LVYVFLDNATDKLVSGAFYYGATTTTPTDAYFTKTVTFSADPGNDAVIAYIVKRATA